MMKAMQKIKHDKYKSARSGQSYIIDLSCSGCQQHIVRYQKDGAGSLMRLYLDRLVDMEAKPEQLKCPGCGVILGHQYIYAREQRPAYRLIAGAVTKKNIK